MAEAKNQYDAPATGPAGGGDVDRRYLLLVAAVLFGAIALARAFFTQLDSQLTPVLAIGFSFSWNAALFASATYFRTRVLMVAAVLAVFNFLVVAVFQAAVWRSDLFGPGNLFLFTIPLGLLGGVKMALLAWGFLSVRKQTAYPGLMLLAGLSFPVFGLFSSVFPVMNGLSKILPVDDASRILALALCVRDAFNALCFWIIYNRTGPPGSQEFD